jgi:hypothetical protein
MEGVVQLFLIGGLIEPRVALVLAYITNNIPANSIPAIVELILLGVLPRLLILIYVFVNQDVIDYSFIWLMVYGLFLIKDIEEERYYGW